MSTIAMDPETLKAWSHALAWDGWLLTFVLSVVAPALGYLRFRRLLARGDQHVPTRTKLTLYGKGVSSQWFLVAVMLLVARRHGLSVGDVGERLGDRHVTFAVTWALLFILAVVSAVVLWRRRRATAPSSASAGSPLLKWAPASRAEMAAFVMVCATAGVCEELLYRGWLVNFIWAETGSAWAAVAVSSVVFGMGHAYQGAKAILRTIFVALQLAILFVAVGSLVPGQVLHGGVDLLAGVAASVALRRRSLEESARLDAGR
jgi:membrane protease YdiL (CAAX protease family)